MKGTFRIGGALILGILIVLGALYVENENGTTEAGGVAVVSDTPQRSPIKTTDSNKNGVADWEESLEEKIFKTIETPTSTTELATADTYEPPTTFTGKFSEAFLEDYLKGKIDGQDFSDPTAFVGNAIIAIDKNVQSKRYSRLELKLIPDSPEALRAYGNKIAEIIKTHSINNKNEAIILQEALAANDPQLLENLKPIQIVYTKIITDTLVVDVPESLGGHHIMLLNAYEAIRTDVEAMQIAFSDPLYALARVKGYQDDAGQLLTALQLIAQELVKQNITYQNTEPGAFFYLFAT